MLAYEDFTFTLLDITVSSTFSQIKIGYKFASLTSAGCVQYCSLFEINPISLTPLITANLWANRSFEKLRNTKIQLQT